MENLADSRAPRTDRRTPLAVSGYYFFSLAGLAIASPYLPLYWKAQGYQGAPLALLLTAVGLGPFLAQGPLGYLSDRRGRRRSLVFALMALGGLCMLFYPLYHSLWLMFFATLIANGTFRSADALVQALIGDWAAGTAMASTYGRLRVFGSIGWVVSLFVSAYVGWVTDASVLKGASWTAPMFLVIGGFYILAAGLILLARPTPPRERLRMGALAAVVAVARAPRVGRFLVAFALFWTGLQGISAFLSLFMKQQMAADHPAISAAFVVSALSESPFIFLAGRLADRWGERRLLLIAFGLLPLRLLVYAAAPSVAWVYVAQAMHSVTYGLVLVGAVTYMAHNLPPALRASGQGALGVVMSGASTLAPFAGGMIAAAAGYRSVFVAMSVVAMVGFLILRGLPERPPAPAEEEACVGATPQRGT